MPNETDFYLPGTAVMFHSKRVLLIVGDESLRRFLGSQLQAWGLLPSVASSGEEALAWLGEGVAFDVAIVAPESGSSVGIPLITALRKLRDEQQLPLILLMGRGGIGQYRTTAGVAQAFLQHPLKPGQLYAVLASLLGEADHTLQSASDAQLQVLLVEDDPTNQVLTMHFVRQLGHHVEVVGTGPAALAALEQGSYDLVLLDIHIPELDGLRVSAEIHRRWPGSTRPTLIALTGNALPGDRERYLAAGMDEYLSKPFTLDALHATIARVIPKHARQTAQEPSVDLLAFGLLRERLVGSGENVFDLLLQTYLDDSAQLVVELAEAAAHLYGERLAYLAHKLKSSSAIVAATRLSSLCEALEQAAVNGSPETWRAQVAAITAEYERARALLGNQDSTQY